MRASLVYRLDELAEIVTGTTPKSSDTDSWGNYMPFLTPSDQLSGQREAVPTRYLSEKASMRLRKRIIPARSTNLTCIGSTIGKVTQAQVSSVTNQQINTLVALEGICDADYLYYLILLWSPTLKLEAAGSATPIINKSLLRRYAFTVHPIEEQRAIAEVLGALDDKIAANTKLAETIDELAHARFVDLLRGAELGTVAYEDLADIGGGGTPKSKVEEYWNGDVNWLTPTDVTALPGPYIADTSRKITKDGLATVSSKLYPVGSIFMTSRATIGAFALAEAPMAVNQGFIVVQPHEPRLRFWLLHEMRSRVQEYKDHANGATFLELSRGRFKKMRVKLADSGEMYAFNAEAATFHRLASQALRENRTLEETRDALLPQLMSGKLRVKDAEAVVSEAV